MNDSADSTQQSARLQLEVIAKLVKKARAVFYMHYALPELSKWQLKEAEAREAAISLSQQILIQEYDLRKKAGP